MTNSTYYLGLFGIFILLAYMTQQDKNVADFIILTGQYIIIQAQRLIFRVKMYPRLRFEYFLRRRGKMPPITNSHMEMAKQVLNNLQDKNNDINSD